MLCVCMCVFFFVKWKDHSLTSHFFLDVQKSWKSIYYMNISLDGLQMCECPVGSVGALFGFSVRVCVCAPEKGQDEKD